MKWSSLARGTIMRMGNLFRWAGGILLAGLMIYAPFLYSRSPPKHSKRLRPIVDGRVSPSGCLTADGFRDAIEKHGIKTVISFWDEDPDPSLHHNRFR